MEGHLVSMFDTEPHFINEEFDAENVSPTQMDKLWENGWRHFGTHFFRYNLGFYGFDIRPVIPLRVRLADFSPSRSQRRVIRKNSDLKTLFRPIEITREKEELFERHKTRFDQGVPNSVYDFLSHDPANIPCDAMEICAYDGERLLATAFFDYGLRAASGVYAMFEPDESHRSLGIFTMLKEIEFATARGKEFYYQGYCYEGASYYDYKKRFRGTERYDWNARWESF